MAGQEARHLRHAINRRVRAMLDNPPRDEHGTLVALRPSGPRVRFDDGRERTVAAWRLSVIEQDCDGEGSAA